MRPSSATVRTMASRMSRRTTASRPEEGSSRISSSGRWATAAIRPAWARMPFESSLTFLDGIERERLEQLARVRRIPCRMVGLRVAHQLVDAHPLRQLAVLGEIADAAQHADRVANRVEAEDAHRAGRGAQQPEQMLEECRLARAVGADEAVDLPRVALERHAVECTLFSKRSREVETSTTFVVILVLLLADEFAVRSRCP